ncbi:MAG: ribosomal protein S18-alanine N-acetyltransferase [Thaumarchaeota archaeon]|nr:ribosomal protein S18-alanine N-acetyltransferase [Nitrososphaerota archaeon]
MSDRVTLRPCRFRDLRRVMEIENESFTDPYPWDEFAAHLLLNRSGFVVACIDSEVVGYVLAAREEGGEGWIRSIAVVPGFRRRGAGAALMEAAMESLAGCDRVILLARRSNEAAMALYRKFAFTETGMVKGYYRDGEDAVKFQWTQHEPE